MNMDISKVADTIVSQASLFECSLEEAWNKYTHPLIMNAFKYEDVKAYIERKIELGESVE